MRKRVQNNPHTESHTTDFMSSTLIIRTSSYQSGLKTYKDKYNAQAQTIPKVESSERIHEQEMYGKSELSLDDYRVDLSPEQAIHFPISVQECSTHSRVSIKGTSGIIYLVMNETSTVTFTDCKWEIVVAEGRFIAARFELPEDYCMDDLFIKVGKLNHDLGFFCTNKYEIQPIFFSSNNSLKFDMYRAQYASTNVTLFYLFFSSVARNGNRFLPVVMTTSTAGFVTSAGFGSKAGYSRNVDASYTLVVPPHHVVMISFSHFDLPDCFYEFLTLHKISTNGLRRLAAVLCARSDMFLPRLFNTSLEIRMRTETIWTVSGTGFRMDFSFHSISDSPEVFHDGSWNCSGLKYYSFKQHVHCNLIYNCAGGEDEGGHCPFSNELCNGSVALGTKCYTLFWNENYTTWKEADQACKTRGGMLAGMRTEGEREAVHSIFVYIGWWAPAWVGIRRVNDTFPHMYWKLWMWSDGVVAYSATINFGQYPQYDHACAYMSPQYRRLLFAFSCSSIRIRRSAVKIRQHICEFDQKGRTYSKRSSDNVVFPDLTHNASQTWLQYPVAVCPAGHVTLFFLSCEPSSMCGRKQHEMSCTTFHRDTDSYPGDTHTDIFTTEKHALSARDRPPKMFSVAMSMFVFANGRTTVPYSLVCDYVPHCKSASDETFCNHGDQCHDITCSNGQCLSFKQKCDNVNDCLDMTDEIRCPPKGNKDFFCDNGVDRSNYYVFRRMPPPTVIYFDGMGNFTQQSLKQSDPQLNTHFACSKISSLFLPVYVRCNGVYDCPGHEDEKDCEQYECPGFYRCRKSRVCVHADHMCDGWPQCPQRDDELYCGLTCPLGCLCQGMAFACVEKFLAREYPQMRYLDARRSNMKPDDMDRNSYLIWLSLALCDIDHVSSLTWPNLMYLDLSQNDIAFVTMDSFSTLPNLKTLILSGNPVTAVVSSSTCLKPKVLTHLDLSETMLRTFDIHSLSCYTHITHLNISYCPLDEITDVFFAYLPHLSKLDISGSPVSTFPSGIFRGLDRLKLLFAANYKLCCKAVLPKAFDSNFCFAPHDEISSCDDLLKSNIFRGSLCLFAALGVAGNVVCFFNRSLSRGKKSHSGFSVFVSNLTVADFLMGMYLVMVGVADAVYRGQYVWHEKTWKNSTACAVAGFLSLLSSEVSAFMICLITLDRFIVLTFPFTSTRFNGSSATVACAVVWIIGGLLVSVPVFPMTPRWEFYGQTGIPLPVTRSTFLGHSYAFGVMILLNFSIFVLITIGQLSIYRSVRANSMTSDNTRRSQDLVIARRLFTVAVSDFLCWFPIGLLGLISFNGVPVSGELSVAMAIFVLPLNSAVNPFLYTFNMVRERRRKEREVQLIKMLESRMLSGSG